ncbi:WG repeat-containing protein [Myroides odoratimimus]|uniref:WG repeat-containing protein n=1 Tax=Myroides odoratimimus TaxID=76832 RepID=UPI000352D765|nr:WG repeat-containing protein [Myroides odoratimimus]EPH11061.1 hypothetical protein HMPREF9713_02188 [Myroides odoratimimus CCUG 12700]
MNRFILTCCISLLTICSFSQGLALFKEKGKIGFLNEKGVHVIPPRFKEARSFNEGLAAVFEKNKWGFINEKGEWVISPSYDKVKDFNYGIAMVLNDKDWFYIDKKNQPFKTLGKTYNFKGGVAFYKPGEKVGLINQEGVVIVPPTYEKIMYLNDEYFKALSQGKWGIIDAKGNIIVSCMYDAVGEYHNGITWVKENEIFYLWNNEQKIELPEVTKIISIENMDYIIAKKEKLVGMINSLGHEVIPFMYENMGELSEGLISARVNGEWGYVNTKNEVVIPFKYDYVLAFGTEGLAAARYNKKWGFIDKEGKELIPFKYEINARNYVYRKRGSGFINGLARVKYKGKWGYINTQGELLGNKWYDNLELFCK